MSLPDLIFRFVIQIMIDVVEPIFLETTFQVHLAVILSIWSLDNRENDEPNFRFSSNLPLQWMFRNMEKFTKNLPQHNWWDKRQRVLKVLRSVFGPFWTPKTNHFEDYRQKFAYFISKLYLLLKNMEKIEIADIFFLHIFFF